MAAEGIDGALPKVNGRKTHFRALPYREVGEALAAVEASPASGRRRERPHRVPLSPEAMEVLERACALNDRGLVFPGRQRGRELSNMTLTTILRDNRLADRATVHGFRSAFRDW